MSTAVEPHGTPNGPSDPDARAEREKWDRVYGSLPLSDEPEGLREFNLEFARMIGDLLPEGGTTLEVGCGAGWQSLALARTGRFQVHLLDFSRAALDYAKRIFEREGHKPVLLLEDAMQPGRPDYDLVFNAGVLEHYPLEQQVQLLRAMRTRSRRYVLAMVPSRRCYWYWIWRMQASTGGRWSFGREVPPADLSSAFEAAGLRYLGQAYVGAEWTEQFIRNAPGLEPYLRDAILAVHRSPLVPTSEKCYLLAVLGTVEAAPGRCPPPLWRPGDHESLDGAVLQAALCDSLALQVAAEARLGGLQRTVQKLQEELARAEEQRRQTDEALREKCAQVEAREQQLAEMDRLRQAAEARYNEVHEWAETLTERLDQEVQQTLKLEARLQDITGGTGWAVLQAMYRVRFFLFPRGSLRERFARLLMRAMRRARSLSLRNAGSRIRAAADALARTRRATEHGQSLPGHGDRTFGAPAEGPHDGDVPGLVSVILPVYNQADLLRDSIESVLAQTYEAFELIVLNDGSTDDVEGVFRDYIGHPKVRLLTQPNQKLPKALSNAFAFARGEFWTWTSADNLMEPRQLERMVAFLRANPAVDMVYADYLAIDDRGEPLRDPAFRPHNRSRPDSPEIRLPRDPSALNQVEDNFIGACFLYRSRAGRALGEYAPELGCEDYDYWMRMNSLFRIAHIGTDEILYRYRVHDNTLNARAAELRIAERVRNLMRYERRRTEFYRRPWTIYADDAVRGAFASANSGGHVLRSLADLEPDGELPEKTLLLVTPAAVDRLPLAAQTGAASVVLCFDADPAAPYRCRHALRRFVDACLCPEAAVASRARLFSPDVFAGCEGADFLALATAVANSRVFLRRTVADDARHRMLPEPCRASKNPARILVQVDDFSQGGLEQVVLDATNVLRDRGFDVSLLVLGRTGPAAGAARRSGLDVLTLPTRSREACYRSLLREKRIDLVNAHFSVFGAAIAAERGIPFVQTVHSCYVFLTPEMIDAYRANDRHTSAYLCTSGNTAMYADLKLGLPPDKMLIAPNGVNPARLALSDRRAARAKLRATLGLRDDDFVFLHVGSIYRDKAQKLIVTALAQVRRDFPKARAVFVGASMDDRYVAEVQQEIARWELGDSVVLAGFQESVAKYYAMADAFLLPSFWEGWSLALAEAVYMGLPVIATAVGGAPELVPAAGGHLIAPPYETVLDLDRNSLSGYLMADHTRFVADLAAAMRRVLEEPATPVGNTVLSASLDYRTAYAIYPRLFHWLLQGGEAAAARPWTWSDPRGVVVS